MNLLTIKILSIILIITLTSSCVPKIKKEEKICTYGQIETRTMYQAEQDANCTSEVQKRECGINSWKSWSGSFKFKLCKQIKPEDQYTDLSAKFHTNSSSGSAPLSITFTNDSIGDIKTYQWDFNNDGKIDSTKQNPQYIYNTPGTYTASLKIINGSNNNIWKENITVTQAPTTTITYYVCDNVTNCNKKSNLGWSTGNDKNDCKSRSTPCKTIQEGIKKMSGGEKLIIGDGIYKGEDNTINTNVRRTPEGSKTLGYTKIHAEHDGEVILDGEGLRAVLVIKGDDSDNGGFASQDYIEIKGIIAGNVGGGTRGAISVFYSNHIKLLNIGAYDATDGNAAGIGVGGSSSYILIEGAYVWGNARYNILLGNVTRSIVRNSIVRHDRSNAKGDPIGGIINYGNADVEIQNCIVIDSNQSQYFQNSYQCQGAFGNPGTSARSFKGPVNYNNCIALNNHLRFATSDWGMYRNDVYYNNCVGWGHSTIDINGDKKVPGIIGATGDIHVNQCTFGDVNTSSKYQTLNASAHFWGWRDGIGKNINSYTNNIMYNLKKASMFLEIEESDYNNVYGVSDSYVIDRNSTNSTNILSFNPLTNGLAYLPRIESNSTLKTSGKDGKHNGAEIIKMFGKPGTMWGEPGYNLLQDGTNGQENINLWPFPNEALIKRKMQNYSYDNGNLSGNRGFANSSAKQINGTDDVTLTSYIWEYLGNPIPCEIYNTCN